MKVVYTDDPKDFTVIGIHIYDQSLLKKIMIPYANNKLKLTRTVYVHNIETDKQWEVIENTETKDVMVKILTKVFNKKYIEKPETFFIKPTVKEKERVVPTYELDEEQWKKPKKKGGMDSWV